MKSTTKSQLPKKTSKDWFGDEVDPIKGTYGVMFIPSERRLKPDSQKVYWETIEADIKSRVEPINPSMNKLYQSLGNRYAVGILSPLVTDSLIKRSNDIEVSKRAVMSSVLSLNSENRYPKSSGLLTNKSRMQSIEDGDDYSIVDSIAKDSQATSIAEKIANFRKKVNQPMRTTEALQLQDRMSSGKYYSPKVAEPYEPAFQCASTALSSYNVNTPKMWPSETQYTKSKKRSQCFESHVSRMPSTHTFGKPAYSTTLKSSLIAENVPLHQSALPSGNVCSKALNLVDHKLKSDFLDSNDSYSEKVSCGSKSLSSLQHALVQCGRLTIAEVGEDESQNKRVQKSIAGQKKRLLSHANWLKHRISGQVIGNDDSIASTGEFLSTHQDKIINLRELKRRTSSQSMSDRAHKDLGNMLDDISSVGSRTAATSVKTTQSSNIYKRYDQELAEHLAIPNPNVSFNPFRPTEVKNMKISHNKRPINALRPTDYRHGMHVKELGGYSLCLKPAKMIHLNDVPSRDEVNASLTTLNRGMTLSYDTRIVETGALLKALQDLKHPSPGLAAIIDLNRGFVDAGCMNPNQWMLNRRQLMGVIATKTPWLETDVIARLISAYDPQHSGIIRFIRISVSLLCCANPAMTSLMSMFQKIALKKEAKKQRAQMLHGTNHLEAHHDQNCSHNSHEHLPFSNESMDYSQNYNSVLRVDKKYESVLFLVRLIHGLYEDCEGGNQINAESRESIGVGMRLEDIVEAFSCCVSNIEDEVKMAKLLEPMIQSLFVNGQRGDIVHFNNPHSSISGKIYNADQSQDENALEDTETVSMLSMGGDTKSSFQSQNNYSRAASLQLGGDSIAWRSTINGEKGYNKSGGTSSTSNIASTNAREPQASVILKHTLLKTTRIIPRVSVDALVDIVQDYISVLDEFYSQLHRFRGLIAPYAKQGSITYEKSVHESLSYGTKDASNRSLFRREL